MARFSNRVAVVTGASRGIGKATVRRLATEGASVCMMDIDERGLKESYEELLKEGFSLYPLTVDVSKRDQVEAAFEEVVKRFGRIDILVNNAGVIRDNLLFKMTDNDWDTVMNVHLKGSFYCSQTAQKVMVQQNYGRIINISSTSALGNRGQANYATAKAGLQGFTKTLALELGKYGITVNAVAPGFVETEMTKATAERIGISFEDMVKRSVAAIPVGRTGKPEDIAHAIAFFAQEESSFINGQVLYVAGGPKA
ncbi:beta-ketoacyl-ACP reductase [Laceyella putida]|uniref:Beta-ketoacyl-ACP reductase n=1 Tax=Laceyella putida TaxID=110101 RepID=A0ABW2RJG3_9BACL